MPMQIGFLLSRVSSFPRRAYTFPILQGGFLLPLLSTILSGGGSVCVIIVACVVPFLSVVTQFGLQRDFVLLQCRYLQFPVKVSLTI